MKKKDFLKLLQTNQIESLESKSREEENFYKGLYEAGYFNGIIIETMDKDSYASWQDVRITDKGNEYLEQHTWWRSFINFFSTIKSIIK